MAEKLGKWPSGRGPLPSIRLSDGCGRNAVPLAVDQWYDFHEFGCHLGNVGLYKNADLPFNWAIANVNLFALLIELTS